MGAKQVLVYCVAVDRHTVSYRIPNGMVGTVTFYKKDKQQEFPMAEVEDFIAMYLKGAYSYDIRDANRKQILEFLSNGDDLPTHCPTCGKPSDDRIAAIKNAPETVNVISPVAASVAPSIPFIEETDPIWNEVESITLEQLEVINKEHGYDAPFDATLTWHQRTHYGYLKGDRPLVFTPEMPDAVQVGDLGDSSTHYDFVMSGEQKCLEYLAEMGYSATADDRSSLTNLATACLRERTARQWGAVDGVGAPELPSTDEGGLPADPGGAEVDPPPVVVPRAAGRKR